MYLNNKLLYRRINQLAEFW